jgi:hypothetical protein
MTKTGTKFTAELLKGSCPLYHHEPLGKICPDWTCILKGSCPLYHHEVIADEVLVVSILAFKGIVIPLSSRGLGYAVGRPDNVFQRDRVTFIITSSL